MYRSLTALLIAAVTLGIAAAPAAAAAPERLVREFSGVGAQETAVFRVEAPWLIEWTSLARSPVEEDIAYLEVHLYRPITNEHIGRVVSMRGIARGQVLIEESGQFRFRVMSQGSNWRLRVIDLDRAGAERLQPLRPGR